MSSRELPTSTGWPRSAERPAWSSLRSPHAALLSRVFRQGGRQASRSSRPSSSSMVPMGTCSDRAATSSTTDDLGRASSKATARARRGSGVGDRTRRGGVSRSGIANDDGCLALGRKRTASDTAGAASETVELPPTLPHLSGRSSPQPSTRTLRGRMTRTTRTACAYWRRSCSDGKLSSDGDTRSGAERTTVVSEKLSGGCFSATAKLA